jgi:hypothetical protein
VCNTLPTFLYEKTLNALQILKDEVLSMHIEDGILSPQACAVYYVATAAFIAPGILEIKNRIKENLYYKPFLAMVGVAVFVILLRHLNIATKFQGIEPYLNYVNIK